MSISPTGGPPPHPQVPTKVADTSTPTNPDKSDSKYSFLLNTPFAQMFARAGATPTAEEMHAIMNGIVMSLLDEMKRQEKHRKEVAQHLKDVSEGKDQD